MFVLYLDVKQITPPANGTPSNVIKPAFRRSLRTAASVPLSQVHQMFDRRMGYDGVERYLAPQPQVMRVLIIDDGLPERDNLDLYTLPVRVALTDARHPFNPHWYRHLKLLVDDKPV